MAEKTTNQELADILTLILNINQELKALFLTSGAQAMTLKTLLPEYESLVSHNMDSPSLERIKREYDQRIGNLLERIQKLEKS